MKLILHCSNTTNRAAESVIDALQQNNKGDSHHIFIVPDRFSLSFEREIFERLSLPGAANIDVVSFMRLAIRELRGKTKDTLTKQGAVLLFKRAIDKNKKTLKRYSRAARSMSFAKEMFAVIASLRNGGYTPSDLSTAAENLYVSTKAKAHDIALLHEAYINELESGYDDATSRLEKLVDQIDKSEWIRQSHIYIAGFHSFSVKEYAVISKLLKTAKEVHVAVTPGNGRASSDRYPLAVFERLKAIASDNGVKIQQIIEEKEIAEPFGTLNGELFTYRAAKAQDDKQSVRLYKENTVYEEANGIAREILYLVREHSYRFKDMAIVNCNPDYQDIFASIFLRYEIPFFIDRKYNLSNTPAAKFIISAAEVKLFNYRWDKVLQFVKNPLFGLSPTESDLFENYILEYNINFNGFLSSFQQDETAEAVRLKLVNTLSDISKGTYQEFAKSLESLLTQAKDNFDNYIQSIDEGEIYASNQRSFDKVSEILTEIQELLGERESSLEEQLETLKSCIASSEISIIPQTVDSVFIGNLRESRYENLKAIFVVAASAGMLPSEQGFRSIISAADSDMLEECGIRLYPTPLDLIREEEFFVLDLLTKAENFYIGYSAFAPTGEALSPSYVIKELCQMLSKEPTSINNRYELLSLNSEKQLVHGAASYKNAYFQYLSYAKRIPKSDNLRIKLLSSLYALLKDPERAVADKLIFEKPDHFTPPANLYFKTDASGAYLTSASQIERYFQCPYRHHLSYGIKLKERKVGRLRALDIGIIIHKALELFFKKTLGKLKTLSNDKIETNAAWAAKEGVEKAVKDGVQLDPQGENVLASIQRECKAAIIKITENVLKSNFQPMYVEQAFGREGFDGLLLTDKDGAEYVLRGKIDRIDTCNNHAIVIDYKTGAAEPSYQELYYGIKVQLYVYLKALQKKKLVPAGAFNLSIRDSYTSEGQSYTMKGYFDKELLHDFDATIALQENPVSTHVFTSLTRKKADGSLSFGRSRYPIDAKKLEEYIDYAQKVIQLGLREMRTGYIAKSPLDTGSFRPPCSMCDYQYICLGEANKREKLSDTNLKNAEVDDE